MYDPPLKVNLDSQGLQVKAGQSFFCVGSCFAREFAFFLKKRAVRVKVNPFGTVYNTYSIYQVFDKILNQTCYQGADLVYENNCYLSLEHSTRFNHVDCRQVLQKINQSIQSSYAHLQKTRFIIITPGTSVVYLYREKIAANCHQLDPALFQKKILTLEENKHYLISLIRLIKKKLPGVKIILTVSPLRHTPHNLTENSYSKALLRAAVQEVVDQQSVFYFPVYEIVYDELQRACFFKQDQLHLKKKAVTYILNQFTKVYFDSRLKNFLLEYKKLKEMVKHKIRSVGSKNHLAHLCNCINRLKKLVRLNPAARLGDLKKKIAIDLVTNFYFHDQAESLCRELALKSNQQQFILNCILFLNQKIDQQIFFQLKPTGKKMIRLQELILLKQIKNTYKQDD